MTGWILNMRKCHKLHKVTGWVVFQPALVGNRGQPNSLYTPYKPVRYPGLTVQQSDDVMTKHYKCFIIKKTPKHRLD